LETKVTIIFWQKLEGMENLVWSCKVKKTRIFVENRYKFRLNFKGTNSARANGLIFHGGIVNSQNWYFSKISENQNGIMNG
jgi:hypothetical protein